ncbi:MAG: aminotransferase class V-fold PLP-dependent enzyme [Clostridia bacterium]|nr:aminotransferase class V-fold PLP-dependent enzyme [Clostridia bacterium]
MIYLDNCSTTHYKPKCVIKAIINGNKKYNYNSGRSGYKKAIECGIKVYNLRQNAISFFNAPENSNVIITKSCTESLNLALRSNIKKNGHIVSTIFEHNSVLRTLDYLNKEYGITYTLATPQNKQFITAKDIETCIKDNTYMIITNHTSNVTGCVCDIENIGYLCKNKNLIYVVDSAQSAGHIDINISKMNINYLAVAGHKGLHGPQGIGLLLCNNIYPKPLIMGGTGTSSESLTQPTDLPEGIESGTLSMANILGLDAAIDYTRKHYQKHHKKICKLTKYFISELEKNPKVVLYSTPTTPGVVSFTIDGYTSNEIVQILDQHSIYIRGGLHCAPKVHEYYLTLDTGMCRVGIDFRNNIWQLKKLIKLLNSI